MVKVLNLSQNQQKECCGEKSHNFRQSRKLGKTVNRMRNSKYPSSAGITVQLARIGHKEILNAFKSFKNENIERIVRGHRNISGIISEKV